MSDSTLNNEFSSRRRIFETLTALIPFRGAPVKSCVFAVVAISVAACTSVGPEKVVSTHVGYNEAVQLTTTREVLINVVRGRYADPMSFLRVDAINAQFSVGVDASAGVGSGGAADVGTSIGYSESPTITFVPQSDAAFYKSMHSPMEIEDVFGMLHWERLVQGDPGYVGRVLRLMFASINGAAEIRLGERNPLFDQRIDALERLLNSGAHLQQVPEFSFRGPPNPRGKLTGEDQVLAYEHGMYFIEEGDGEWNRMALYRLVVGLVLPDPDDPKTVQTLGELGVQPGQSQYVFRPPNHSRPGSPDSTSIWVTPRSLADVLVISGQFVQVPASHRGIVPAMDHTIDSRIQILSSAAEPPFPYRVQHRDYWFYIDDSDANSRAFLRFLTGLYKSRLGSREAVDAAPQLVLPLGDG